MSEIKIYKPEEMKGIIETIPTEKIVFWIGAGIDSGKPTSLPLGNGLTDYILQKTCGNKARDLINIWKRNQKLLNYAMEGKVEVPDRPRLETIIEAVREFEDHQLKKRSIIEGLRSFSSKEFSYNREHFLLAQFLHKGANIVTTNYGDFICKAYAEKYGEEKIIHECTDMHVYRVKNRWSSGIYHIHGIANDLDTIGANLSTVKNSLPESFKKQLKYWMSHEYTVIFMGYSGLDTLDVNPFLETFDSDKGKTGIYVRHSQQEEFSKASEKEKRLLYAFSDKYVCPCLTKDFFELFNVCDDTRIAPLALKKEREWRKIFSKYAGSYDRELRDAFLSGLCYYLGISVAEVFGTSNWLPKVLKSGNIDYWYKHYYAFENAVMTGQRTIVVSQGKLLRNGSDELMENDYQAARSRIYKVMDAPQGTMLEEIRKNIKEGKINGWDISTKLNRYVEGVFFNSIKNNLFVFHDFQMSKKYLNGVKCAEKCLELILGGGYDHVYNVNQISTAYRSYGLCQILLGEETKGAIYNLDIALKNYADISSFNGVAVTTMYKALIYLIDYKKSGRIRSFKNANKNLRKGRALIFTCKLKKYYSRYYFSKIYEGIQRIENRLIGRYL